MATNVPITGETPITIKISIGEEVKKLKLPLKDLTADVLPARLISILGLPTDKQVTFERFSDSAGGFITLESTNTAVYKTLVRAAKAKLKLRLRALVEGEPVQTGSVISQTSKVLTSDIMARPDILASLSKLPQPTDRKDAFQKSYNLDHVKVHARKNIGAGIFEFKDTHTSTQTNTAQSPSANPITSAPVPAKPFKCAAVPTAGSPQTNTPVSFLEAYNTDMQSFASQCEPVLVFRRKSPVGAASPPNPTWTVYCNECDATLKNEHFHCSICDGGDYDLCQRCVDGGKLCPGQGHWLVKRFVKNGMIISSTTERLAPKGRMCSLPVRPVTFPKAENIIPGAFTEDAKTLREDFPLATRTCNSCVDVMSDDHFVTCKDCDDYDLCLKCHAGNRHGHHPGHTFTPAVEGKTLTKSEQALLAPGRRTVHAAICDGCEKGIIGIRHKCFDCPDFDYCNDCVRAADSTHPGHRFAALYDRIALVHKAPVVHHGVYCDGPACMSNPRQTFITGVRYKCAVCDDTDFCANCEALPHSAHNKTHPLLKMTTPVRGLSISTVNDVNGKVVSGLGDKASRHSAPSIPTLAPAQAPVQMVPQSSASSVKTVAFIEPTVTRDEVKKEAIGTPKEASSIVDNADLQAVFVCDTIPDGITVRGDTRFTQVWTMRNPGPIAWPAGCSVRLAGGDNMLNVDRERPFSAIAMNEATESNVIGREVLPGEEVAFKVVMRAPARDGRAISYWRLKTADGTPFGHRLWCDVNVRAWEGMRREDNSRAGPDHSRFEAAHAPYVAQLANKLDSARQRSVQEKNPEEQRLAEVSESPMVYPTLEKESPASSINLSAPSAEVKSETTAHTEEKPAAVHGHAKAATMEDESTGNVVSATIPSTSSEVTYAESEAEVFDDISSEIEVLSAGEEVSDEDDGFLTDEEYDILDASDQETIASSN
ncbi:hypothetical protein K461DRAFT_251869 [Myriangium duriaei CBS 260.36]|uniref:ZZ-type domain-containing protein n=1 Tax=Myriangium duriaei CBS 260.36 TaxID=1168546 RepID=A0A9P4J6L0_9PEZI|nr:hypothetical protein K461DRAFT_251869 [Myriangium duriaei CBS 260.36]